MNLHTELYVKQLQRWPTSGRHILAQFDASTVIVYQALNCVHYCSRLGMPSLLNIPPMTGIGPTAATEVVRIVLASCLWNCVPNSVLSADYALDS